ncbi:UNVERIFIED_CONTAM: hypothetical protein K2H54_068097 [Gekko kuhli]
MGDRPGHEPGAPAPCPPGGPNDADMEKRSPTISRHTAPHLPPGPRINARLLAGHLTEKGQLLLHPPSGLQSPSPALPPDNLRHQGSSTNGIGQAYRGLEMVMIWLSPEYRKT